ncbi:peptidoglycan endopeptidase [Pseudomonas cavernicola]|uniref:Peptidoglycan endopeptidase n=1 Tax=Pseudomonas cavernicola TaxID=2320866 RepID=A0A418XJ28_9PSED|nr:C40 family peptidase [Pseudomonas cavernicola]RJG12467.1 peptidoglycan endopeptidase [Pseudomonas cavernicola]
MRSIYLTWLAICLSLPLAAQATNRYQPLPVGSTGHTVKAYSASSRSTPNPSPSAVAAEHSSNVLSRAVNALGIRYRWGGSTPEKGFDCSGLVKYAFGDIDEVDLPRTSNAMSRADGQKVARDQLEPGDLLFFNIRSRKVNHVAIYLGNDRFIHAPRRGKNVTIDTLNKPYWKRHYVLAKRVLPNTETASGSQLRLSQR